MDYKSCQRCTRPLDASTTGDVCPVCVLSTALFDERLDPVEPLSSGRRFGRFEILAEIGRGGMGIVYRARDTELGRVVALKLLLAGPYSSPEALERFRAEARAAAALQHPNIVPLHESGEVDEQPYFTMDFVAGRNLAELAKSQPFSATRAARCVRAIADAIQHAHELGVLHRDLKPSNILLDADDRPFITDFGLAKRLGADDLTVTGELLGSPGYMAPEQSRGRPTAGPAADVYSLGAVLYYLLTTRPPFIGATATETLRLVLEREPLHPRVLNPAVPRDLDTICLTCLQKDPSRRYRSARELADELSRFLDGKPIRARPLSPVAQAWRWCRRHPAFAALAATVVLALTATSAIFYVTARRIAQARVEEQRAHGRAEENYFAEKILNASAGLNSYSPDLYDVRSSLEALRPAPGRRDLRGFEWRYLWRQTRGDATYALRGHAQVVDDARFSPDGAWIVTRSIDDVAKLWRASDAQERYHLTQVDRIGGFDSGGRLVFSRRDGAVYGFDPATARETRLLANAGPLLGVAADGERVILLAADGRPTLRALATDAATAASATQPPLPLPPGTPIAVSHDRRRVALPAGSPLTIAVIDVPTRTTVATLAHPRVVIALALSPDGSQLVTTGFDGVLKFWDVGSASVVRELKLSLDPAWAVTFSPDGRYLAAAGNDRSVRIWDAQTGETRVLMGHEDPILALDFSPDGRRLVSGAQDDLALVWPLDKPQVPNEARRLLRGPEWTDRLPHLAFSNDSRRFAGTASDGTVKVWDATTLLALATLPVEARTVKFGADADELFTQSYQGEVKRWRVGEKVPIETIAAPAPFENWSIAPMSPRERVATFNSPLGSAELCSLCEISSIRDGVVAGTFPSGHAVAPTPRGDTVFLGLPDGTVEAWDVASNRKKFAVAAHKLPVSSLAVSADGRLLASGSLDNMTKLWDAATGAPIASFGSHNRPVWALAFSPDGQTLAAGSCDKAIILCSVPLRRIVMTLWLYHGAPAGYEQEVRLLRFAPDGNTLAAALGDGTVRFFRAATFAETDAALGGVASTRP